MYTAVPFTKWYLYHMAVLLHEVLPPSLSPHYIGRTKSIPQQSGRFRGDARYCGLFFRSCRFIKCFNIPPLWFVIKLYSSNLLYYLDDKHGDEDFLLRFTPSPLILSNYGNVIGCRVRQSLLVLPAVIQQGNLSWSAEIYNDKNSKRKIWHGIHIAALLITMYILIYKWPTEKIDCIELVKILPIKNRGKIEWKTVRI